ncbi:hypothetical protein Z517_00833 [Fonsecaea pedrosoi CBS 271.37]|uniref:Unplaced genomic scaffold supercont1.1, whole genome shotgun sequence n=1 Tax=Fonsecaea pedrosoi CBS 271.37 TaxID=1442368 RepID=A0A0D2GWS1_9EURO|nr:uncharacterized protein Z517_00833 [Fonsecaea pedrosoi CBS 271.37]KIW85443.1 hypothetical protein Z517_00833 [Fonsecaea pedrosoi CBS 271.37]
MESSTLRSPQEAKPVPPYTLPERKCRARHNQLVPGTLCSVCEALDVNALLAPATEDVAGELRPGVHLGTLSHLRDCASHCPFCSLIVDQTPPVISPEAVKPEHFEYKEHSHRVPAPIDHWRYGTDTLGPDDVIVSLRSFRGDMEHLQDLPMMAWKDYLDEPTATWLEILVHSGGQAFGNPDEGMAITCQKRLVPCLGDRVRAPLGGRTVAPQVEYSELRSWLDSCLQNHEECLLREFKSSAAPEKHFWLIDTVERKIVLADQNAEYATLSYVWGDAQPKYISLKEIAPSNGGNQKPGADLPRDLPSTISDAIEFCCGLGIPFLWVDSLCIDQDDQDMKDFLIDRMHTIYMNAKVTIIAAAGDDANAGLPGVRPGTRTDDRPTVRLQGIEFTTNHLPAKQLITRSAWWTRAWTFQEGWLSPRCFIFTAEEVLFCCTRWTSRESLRSCRPHIRNGLATRVFQTHELGFPAGVGQILEEPRISSLFNNVMRLYHRRRLSLESDKIRAVQGCINTIAESHGISGWHGMPMQWGCIAGALMWRHLQLAKRTNLAFPSYSWASWDAEPVYFREFDVFQADFARIEELEPIPGLPPTFSPGAGGCPPLSFTGEVALLHIKPSSGDAWSLDEQRHVESAPGLFADCYPAEAASGGKLQSSGPREFLGIARGFHRLSNQVLVMTMMIKRKEGYVVRSTVLCVTDRVWSTADRWRETLVLL